MTLNSARIVTNLAGALVIFALGCTESPTRPTDPEISRLEIRHTNGALLYAWSGTVAAADTIRLAAGDSIPIQFRWLDGSGQPVSISPSSLDLTVTTSHPGIARWRPHPSEPSRGAFITGALLQPVTTAVSVELGVRGALALRTSLIPLKVRP